MNIFLIGYRGTGKSFIGKDLARQLKFNFIDLDSEIVKQKGKTIPQIFSEEGEKRFREYETEELKTISERTNQVISCGGGIVVMEENLVLLKKGFVVLLSSGPEIIFKRISSDKNRPALTNLSSFEEIKFMLAQRKELYNKIKNFEIDTGKDGLNDYVKRIIQAYKKFYTPQ